MRLSDEHWQILSDLLSPPERTSNRGRPRRPDKDVLEGILWVLRTGAQWEKLPRGEYPPKSTCFARFQEWNERGVFPLLLARLYELLEDEGLLDLREAFQGGTFSAAKKGALRPARRKKAKAPRSW